MITGIRHIIFDLGGVLLNIDYKLTEQALIETGIKNFTELYSQLNQTELFDKFEMGFIPRDEFIEVLKKNCSRPVSETQIINAWNAMLLDFPLRRLQLLQQLHLYYDLVLLSKCREFRALGRIHRFFSRREASLHTFRHQFPLTFHLHQN